MISTSLIDPAEPTGGAHGAGRHPARTEHGLGLFRFWVLVRLSVSCALKRVASREDGSRAHESPRPYFYTHHAEKISGPRAIAPAALSFCRRPSQTGGMKHATKSQGVCRHCGTVRRRNLRDHAAMR